MQMEFTDAGFLDDLVTASPEYGREICQIKFSVHPEAPTSDWKWKTLLSKRKSTKETLFAKWACSLFDFSSDAGKTTGHLITNRSADKDFLQCLKPKGNSRGLFIDLRKMRLRKPNLYREVLRQASSKQR